MLNKLLIIFLGLTSFVYAQQCPYPSTNYVNGYVTRYCYYYAGETKSYTEAINVCRKYGMILNMPKTDAGLDDLYKLYKSYSNFYFWVGASASPSNPFQFYFADNSPVFSNHFCKGNPKGGDNLCGFYTTTAVIGRDKCITTGECKASFFDHGIICQATF